MLHFRVTDVPDFGAKWCVFKTHLCFCTDETAILLYVPVLAPKPALTQENTSCFYRVRGGFLLLNRLVIFAVICSFSRLHSAPSGAFLRRIFLPERGYFWRSFSALWHILRASFWPFPAYCFSLLSGTFELFNLGLKLTFSKFHFCAVRRFFEISFLVNSDHFCNSHFGLETIIFKSAFLLVFANLFLSFWDRFVISFLLDLGKFKMHVCMFKCKIEIVIWAQCEKKFSPVWESFDFCFWAVKWGMTSSAFGRVSNILLMHFSSPRGGGILLVTLTILFCIFDCSNALSGCSKEQLSCIFWVLSGR